MNTNQRCRNNWLIVNVIILTVIIVFVFLTYFPTYLPARPSDASLRDAHHEFDRAFVEWTNRVNEKAEHVSLASPDFWDEPREWWFEMEMGRKFRRLEEELTDDTE